MEVMINLTRKDNFTNIKIEAFRSCLEIKMKHLLVKEETLNYDKTNKLFFFGFLI